MAEFPTPTILGSSSNGRTSRLQRENARSIRVDSMGLSSKGKTPRSLRGDACSSHASSTCRGDVRFYLLVGVWGHRPTGGHQAGSLGMRVRFPLVPLHRQRAGREPVSKTSFCRVRVPGCLLLELLGKWQALPSRKRVGPRDRPWAFDSPRLLSGEMTEWQGASLES